MDYSKLRAEIRDMSRHSKIYKVLKEELTAKGYWKNRPRGNPKKGYKAGFGSLSYTKH